MPLHLFAAVPSHSGTIVLEAVHTLVGVLGYVANRGGTFRLYHQTGSTVSLVRNAIAAAFLESRADYLLMLDSDQAIGAQGIARMMELDRPVVGCVYPRRGAFNWSNVDLETATSPEQIIYQASEYVGQLIADENGKIVLMDGFAPAEFVGTGVMLIHRSAFEMLMSRYPELKGRGFGPGVYPAHDHSGRWGFFNPIDDEQGVPLGEDISFCRRWRAAGGEIWADVVSPVMHVGRYTHVGNFVDFAAANRLPVL